MSAVELASLLLCDGRWSDYVIKTAFERATRGSSAKLQRALDEVAALDEEVSALTDGATNRAQPSAISNTTTTFHSPTPPFNSPYATHTTGGEERGHGAREAADHGGSHPHPGQA